MKQPKITKEEKTEQRVIKRIWSDLLRRMKKRGALVEDSIKIMITVLIIGLLLQSCTAERGSCGQKIKKDAPFRIKGMI